MKQSTGQIAQLVAVGGISVVAICWSASPDIAAPFKAELGSSVPSIIAGMGVLVVLVERATEVVVNAVRMEETIMTTKLSRMEQQLEQSGPEYSVLKERLERYKLGTQRLSLLVGLALGVFIGCTGVGILANILNLEVAVPRYLQLRRAVDILLTAGLLAGGSQAFHENVANKINAAINRDPGN